jgi:ElaB/YqjD/DUF883 family membrane-anchored ribosome-binding protein
METFTQTLTAVESTIATAGKYVAKTAPAVLINLENWIIANPKKALAIAFFIVGFILGTLI